MRIAAVILAAGAATRMGKTKQLLPFRGSTLVEHAIFQAQQAGFSPLVPVVGAESAAVSEAIRRTANTCALNADWALGMGSSITAGVTAVLRMTSEIDGIALLLADQPYVTHTHLSSMRQEFEISGAPVVAALYAGTVGVPAIFARSLIPILQSLPPSAGARQLLRQPGSNVHGYPLPEAAVDIDTPEDFLSLR